MVVQKAFSDIGGDYNNPTKESLQKIVSVLKAYSKNFRSDDIVDKHAFEIGELIDLLK